jgi:hypothetical protein
LSQGRIIEQGKLVHPTMYYDYYATTDEKVLETYQALVNDNMEIDKDEALEEADDGEPMGGDGFGNDPVELTII